MQIRNITELETLTKRFLRRTSYTFERQICYLFDLIKDVKDKIETSVLAKTSQNNIRDLYELDVSKFKLDSYSNKLESLQEVLFKKLLLT